MRISLKIVSVCAVSLLWTPMIRADEPPPPASQPAPTSVFRAAEAPNIDGKLDDACWKAATPTPIEWVHGVNPPRKSETPLMKTWFAWDERYLYIAYETFDKNITGEATGQMQGPKGNQRPGAAIFTETTLPDVVEFFLNVGDERFFWEIHHNALNQFNDVWITVVDSSWPISKSASIPYGIRFAHEEFIPDEELYTVKMATALKPKADGKPSTPNDASDEDAGYTGEIRLPWLGINAPRDRQTSVYRDNPDKTKPPIREPGPWKMAGFEMTIQSVLQDADRKDRYLRSSERSRGSWFHMDAALWPKYRLSAETGAK